MLGSFETGTGGGGTGGTTGGGGTTTTVDCAQQDCCTPEDCPVLGNECIARACNSGTCAVTNEPEGKVIPAQVPGDCKQVVCDGAGAEKEVLLATDTMDDGAECTTDTCVAGAPVHANLGAGTARAPPRPLTSVTATARASSASMAPSARRTSVAQRGRAFPRAAPTAC